MLSINNDFKEELRGLKESTGVNGFKIGKKFAMHNFLPLTNYLVNKLWKEQSGDSAAMSFSKTVARGLTYFFSALTLAPIYQSLFYGIPKRLCSIKQHNDFAKSALQALSTYNDLRHKMQIEAEHEIGYLAPGHIEEIGEQVGSGQIVINIPADKQVKVREKLAELERAKNDKYDVIINAQVKEVVNYLKGINPEDRLQAHKDILEAFMTHVGFDDVFIKEDERLEFALDISNRIGQLLIEAEAKDMVDNLNKNNNFIKFNQSVEKLSKDIVSIFGIELETATALVGFQLKQKVLQSHTNLGHFSRVFSPKLASITTSEDKEFNVLLESVKHHFEDTVGDINEKYNDLEDLAILQDAREGLAILNKDVKKLLNQEKQLTKDLVTINGKLKVLAQGGHYYHLSKINDTREELVDQRNGKEALLKIASKDLGKKMELLGQINNKSHLDFNGPEIQALKKVADETLEKERALKDGKLNLGAQNLRAFRACLALLQGVNENQNAEAQAVKITALTKNLSDDTMTFLNVRERIARALGFGRETVTLIQTLRDHLNTTPVNVPALREAVRTLYEKMTPCQKAYFAEEVARHSGKTAWIFKTEPVNFGKSYIENFINDHQATDFSLIAAAIRSQEGKSAAEYQPYTRFNNWYWNNGVTG